MNNISKSKKKQTQELEMIDQIELVTQLLDLTKYQINLSVRLRQSKKTFILKSKKKKKEKENYT